MSAICFTIIILSTALLIQTQNLPQLVSLTTAELGETVTLHCEIWQEFDIMLYWYKQSLGFIPQLVASKMSSGMVYFPFQSRVTVGGGTDFNLTIRNINKEDEANYFCQQGNQYIKMMKCGTFLAVNDHSVFLTVVQQPASASVQLGDPVVLQCSITSQRMDHSNQCQGEQSVYWFRSGSSHPAAIYMNGNRSGECQNSSGPPSPPQSCVYTLPKNNVSTSDAGTYYCALAACGGIVFGNGTKLDIKGTNWLLYITTVLGVLLVFCLVVILILFLTRHKKQVYEHYKGTQSASYNTAHDSVNKDGETESLNYAALEFSGRKTKGRKKNKERTQESLYPAVRETGH